MTQDEIRELLGVYNRRLAVVYASVKQLQTICTHPSVTKRYRSDTGNYDPGCNSYWIDYHCPDCGKIWTEDQ